MVLEKIKGIIIEQLELMRTQRSPWRHPYE